MTPRTRLAVGLFHALVCASFFLPQIPAAASLPATAKPLRVVLDRASGVFRGTSARDSTEQRRLKNGVLADVRVVRFRDIEFLKPPFGRRGDLSLALFDAGYESIAPNQDLVVFTEQVNGDVEGIVEGRSGIFKIELGAHKSCGKKPCELATNFYGNKSLWLGSSLWESFDRKRTEEELRALHVDHERIEDLTNLTDRPYPGTGPIPLVLLRALVLSTNPR